MSLHAGHNGTARHLANAGDFSIAASLCGGIRQPDARHGELRGPDNVGQFSAQRRTGRLPMTQRVSTRAEE